MRDVVARRTFACVNVSMCRPATPLARQPLHLTELSTASAGSVGGEICIWKADGDWELMKTMKGHKAAVNCLAAHPSGSLALSVSRDKQMRLWDLTKGSCAYQAPLGSEGDVVGFFPSGDTYFIASSDPSTPKGSNISIHNTQVQPTAVAYHTLALNTCSPGECLPLPQQHRTAHSSHILHTHVHASVTVPALVILSPMFPCWFGQCWLGQCWLRSIVVHACLCTGNITFAHSHRSNALEAHTSSSPDVGTADVRE